MPPEVRIPVAEERVRVEKRRRRTGVVRVDVKTARVIQTLDIPLDLEEVDVERVPIGRFVDAAAPVRTEGEVTIVPVYEEVVVKQLVLKEELRIKKRTRRVHRRHEELVRRQEVRVSRRE